MGNLPIPEINFNFWILQSITMGLTALLLPNLRITNPLGAVGIVIALAFVNAHLWDAALFFSVPDQVTLEALTLILMNGLIFWVLVKILPGIEVKGVLPALVAPVVFTVLGVIINNYGRQIDWIDLGKKGVAQMQQLRDEFRDSTKANAGQAENAPTPKPR